MGASFEDRLTRIAQSRENEGSNLGRAGPDQGPRAGRRAVMLLAAGLALGLLGVVAMQAFAMIGPDRSGGIIAAQ
ncbi:hypothetical protein [Salipiger mucosus]|uniref:Uncharacterized protein n=1 Tax=Salipiger mucosus DSM 16094 TaxID=1123237 RepID=S9QPD5_9RHOB|nr:hypothetical protein [Salipiger mucosus]EPX81453.1 hypothetical protein Salmuc_05119 [Salipiger mucosus DSM 16094]